MKRWLVVVAILLIPPGAWGEEDITGTGEVFMTAPTFVTGPVFGSVPCPFVRCGEGFQKVIHDGKCECEREYGTCPICGSKGEKLGWIVYGKEVVVSIFSDSAHWSYVGPISDETKDIYICPKCHSLFWENSKKEE